MRYGLFGGAFDPPHYGHVMSAEYAIVTGELDYLYVVPTYRHPLKVEYASFVDRLAMLRVMFPTFESNKIIIDHHTEQKIADRKGNGDPVFTVETVESLKASCPGDWFLVVGTDEASTIGNWHRSEDLLRMVDLVVVPRGEISSTSIREILHHELWLPEELKDKVPPKVLSYIKEHNLYR